MPQPDPQSPWSAQAYVQAPAEPVATQAAHAWLSSEPYGSAAPVAYPAAYAPTPAVAPAAAPVQVHVAAPSGRGLAVLGVVLGGLALLGVLLVLVLVAVMFLGDGGDTGGGGGSGEWPVRGTVAPATDGQISGEALAAEVTRKMTESGEDPAGITCPTTAKVAQDVTTVCHGTDYGADTALVVFFEDAKGSYTLLPI